MKKTLIYVASASLALLVGITTTALINNASAETTNNNTAIPTLTDQTSLGTAISTTKNETVYVITDHAGAPTKTFIGSVLDSTESDLPVKLAITYYLNGQEISAKDLAGQSGHVKIIYDYTATKTYQGKYIPFLALTGITLDNTKFQNVKVTNGKIISESDKTILAGYSFAGINADLDTDFLPESFIVEADTANFELDTTYTLATNEIFSELDTSKLSTIDDLINSMNQLGSATDQILTGATSLSDGIGQLAANIPALQSGAEALNSGANQLTTGLNTLNNKVESELVPNLENLATGLNTLSENSSALNTGVQETFANLLTNLQAVAASTTDPYTTTAINQIITSTTAGLPTLYTQLGTYTGTVDHIATATANLDTTELTTGVAALANGADQLLSGTTKLKTGVDALASGTTQLASGSQTLANGIATFKSEGIDRLVDFANHDLANFTTNARATISAAKSYHNYKTSSAQNVKFIFKTPSIK